MCKRKLYFKKVRIKTKYLLLGILGIAISYLLFFFIYCYIAEQRLNTVIGKSNFDVTTILDISKERITIENETYNKKEFIEYDCIIDSIYCVSIVKVGKVSNVKILDSIYFENEPFPIRTGWFNYDITSPHPMTNMVPISCIPFYNVFLVPFKKINKINIFVEGYFVEEEWLNNMILTYSLRGYHVFFSFDNMNKCDLHFSHSWVKDPLFSIFLTVDEKNDLYIGSASTVKGTPKTLKEILNNEISPIDTQ